MTVVINQVLTGLSSAVSGITTILTSGNLATIATNIASLTTQMTSMQASLDVTNVRLNTLNGYMAYSGAGLAAWVADIDTKWQDVPSATINGFANQYTAMGLLLDKYTALLADTTTLNARLATLADRIADPAGEFGANLQQAIELVAEGTGTIANRLDSEGEVLAATLGAQLTGLATQATAIAARIAPEGDSIAAKLASLTLGTGFTAVANAIDGLGTPIQGITAAMGFDDLVVATGALGALVAGAGNLADRIAPNGSSVSADIAAQLAQITSIATGTGNLADMKTQLQAVAGSFKIGGVNIFDKASPDSALAEAAGAAWSQALKTQAMRLYGPNGKLFEVVDYGNPA